MSPRQPAVAPGINEGTKVSLKLSTMWGIVTSMVITTAWLTSILLKIYFQNNTEHKEMLDGIKRLESRSSEFVTRGQLEEALVSTVEVSQIGVLRSGTNLTYSERDVREAIRRSLRVDHLP